jgi:diacylglycerol O-acyltransferase
VEPADLADRRSRPCLRERLNPEGRSTIPNDSLNRRLSFHDAVFLHWERRNQPMHVGECMVYDGHFSRDELVDLVADRLHLIPRYRQRVVPAPLRLSYPTWEDDPDFDLERHVEELEMPAPGDDRTLSSFGGKLFSERLDRDHPLWKISVIQGHESGNTILLMRLHHSMVDGVSAVALVDVMHSVDPDGESAPAPPVSWEPKPLPGTLRLLQDALADRVDATASTFKEAAGLLRPSAAARQARELALLARTWVRSLPIGLLPPPKTPWNREISPNRQFAWLELPFQEARSIRRTLGGTVNDLILAVLAGGLGRYLRRHGYDTEGVKLRTMVPVSMRRPGEEGPMGNAVSLVVVPLHVGVDDAIERLNMEREAMDRAKAENQAAGIYQIIQMSRRVPPPVHELQWRLSPTSAPWPINIVSTNVPGPQVPLYLAGRKMLHWYPLGVPWTTLGLFLCTLSYDKRLVLGLVADPSLVPDLWDVVDDLHASYQELLTAARARAASAKPRSRGAPASRKRARSTAA